MQTGFVFMAAGVALPLKAQKLPDWPGTVLTSKVEGHLSGGRRF